MLENGKCPLCGGDYTYDPAIAARDIALCTQCGAGGRAQAIGYFVGRLLNNLDDGLMDETVDKSRKVMGMSDNAAYAARLAKKFNYTNTHVHKEPYLDIRNPTDEYKAVFDLVISSDVFEHVAAPCDVFFRNTLVLLKPGGHLIMTVPYTVKHKHVEHYPGIVDYDVTVPDDGQKATVLLHFDDGSRRHAPDPVFHGGPGKTLELRRFSKASIELYLANAGFTNVEFHETDIPQIGYTWGGNSRVVTAQRPSRSE